MSLQPSHARTQGRGAARRRYRTQRRANTIGARVAAATRDHAQATAAHTARRLPNRILVGPLHEPPGHAAVKRAVRDHVAAALGNNLYVINEAFAFAEQEKLELIGSRHRPV